MVGYVVWHHRRRSIYDDLCLVSGCIASHRPHVSTVTSSRSVRNGSLDHFYTTCVVQYVAMYHSFHYYHFVKTELICPLLPSISVKFVVYLVCAKLLSELLSIIRFPHSSDNTTTSTTNGTSPHSPMQQPTLLILVPHPPELPLFSHEWTCQIREQKRWRQVPCFDEVFSIVFVRLIMVPLKEPPSKHLPHPAPSPFIIIPCLSFNSARRSIREGMPFVHQYSCKSGEVVFGEPNRCREQEHC